MLPQVKMDTDQFQDLVEEYRDLIAGLYPEWTDYNYHDPGMTFLELFAWLKENQQFYMEQLGDSHYEAFFRLLGFQRRERRPAVLLALGEPRGDCYFPRGARFLAGGMVFETEEEENLTDSLKMAVHIKKDGSAGERAELSRPSLQGELYFHPLGTKPEPGDSCVFLYERPLRAGTPWRLSLQMEENQERLRNPRRPGEPFLPFVTLAWSVYTDQGWTPLADLSDETDGLLFSGRVSFSFDGAQAPLDDRLGHEFAGKYAVRAELLENTYDLPPLLSGLTMNQAVLVQKETWRPDAGAFVLAEADGFPDQEYALPWKEPVADTVQLEVENVLEPGRFTIWKQTRDLDSCGPSDQCYLVDEDQGTVRFGDGYCGMPPEGTIRLLSMEETKGSRGNVKRGTRLVFEELKEAGRGRLSKPGGRDEEPEKGLTVSRILRPGRDRETMEEALFRLGTEKREPLRAVTAADYEKAAMETPGLVLYSCKVLPARGGENQVTMVVRPGDGVRNLPLSDGYRAALFRYLDRRRLLGTRLKFLAPEYIGLKIYLEVAAMPQYRQAEAMVREAAARWFSRLGTAFGEPVSFGDLYGAIDSLACVKRLAVLNVEARSVSVSRNQNGDLIPPENGVFLLNQIEYTAVNE